MSDQNNTPLTWNVIEQYFKDKVKERKDKILSIVSSDECLDNKDKTLLQLRLNAEAIKDLNYILALPERAKAKQKEQKEGK